MKQPKQHTWHRGRRLLVATLAVAAFLALGWRAVMLQVVDRDFLRDQGQARHTRVVPAPAHRGMITDRHGEPLAISTPVSSVWTVPAEILATPAAVRTLAQTLELAPDTLRQRLERRQHRQFVYVRRHVSPALADRVQGLGLPGVYLQREYKRYYPAGEVAGHVVGFTNIDDVGQEGLELAFNDWLQGKAGSKRVIQDRYGRVVEMVEQIRTPEPGQDLALSLDLRLQYLAYRALKSAVQAHDAKAGSLALMDARTGEVLAMANQPAFNPNDRASLSSAHYRNRAVTDVFEPGSTTKPFTVACALTSGKYRPDTAIDTGVGYLRVAGSDIHDTHGYGRIDVSTVIQKSSNVGAAKIALSLPGECLWSALADAGFGRMTASGFPGEASGTLPHHTEWGTVERAVGAYGYGFSASALQLARAYALLANDGKAVPVTLLRRDEAPVGRQVLPVKVVRAIQPMLERVVESGGTGTRAAVAGYRVAGKTGTVIKSDGGYESGRYLSLFAGMAPASDPRLVLVVMVDEPQGRYYGGQVAAPVFAQVMADALRLMNVPPDALRSATRLADAGGSL